MDAPVIELNETKKSYAGIPEALFVVSKIIINYYLKNIGKISELISK